MTIEEIRKMTDEALSLWIKEWTSFFKIPSKDWSTW